MGGSLSRNPSFSKRFDVVDILNEKEYIFLVLQNEIDVVVTNNDKGELLRIEKEINGHIQELKSFLETKRCGKEISERIQRLIYNYEIALAKVKSIFFTMARGRVRTSQGINKEAEVRGTSVRSDILTIADDNFKEKANENNNNVIKKETADNEEVSNKSGDLVDENEADSDDEPIYANVETLPEVSERKAESSSGKSGSFRLAKSKRPVPIPRNQEEILVKDIPRHFTRLNELLEKNVIDSDDIEEVLYIRKKSDDARSVFIAKIDQIFKKYENNLIQELEHDN